MVLQAMDEFGCIVSAKGAQREKSYRCRECGQTVRLRSGPFRRPHFCHLSVSKTCRNNGKSFQHMAVQEHLIRRLPYRQAALEWHESEIERIADVAWFQEGIVFEVQCSPITPQELLKRNADWKLAGYRVIWILHDRRYNKRRLHPIELALQGQTFYYTNIDEEGRGDIYDQYDFLDGHYRNRTLYRAVINEFIPQSILSSCVPRVIEKRIGNGQPLFTQDVTGVCFNTPKVANRLIRTERKMSRRLLFHRTRHLLTQGLERVKGVYRGFFFHLLERACR